MAGRDRNPQAANPRPMSGYGTYANRPAAASVPTGFIFTATDIGIEPGCMFRSTGSAWQQVGSHYLSVNIASVTVDTGNPDKSVFVTAPTLPNDCVGVRTIFEWEYSALSNEAGATVATITYREKIGSTVIGSWAGDSLYGYPQYTMRGSMVCRAVGNSGTVMGLMTQQRPAVLTIPGTAGLCTEMTFSATPVTVDTSAAAISPDVRIEFTFTQNGPIHTVISAWIKVSGLV